MKTIGLLGGMSWESTAVYYRIINRMTRERLGGLHSAKCLLYSFDFAEIEQLQDQGQWLEAGELLADAAKALEAAGAELIVLCSNTMHVVADAVDAALRIPLLHLVDTTADVVVGMGLRRVALLGTTFTMEQSFYRNRLTARGLNIMLPGPLARKSIHRIIYHELCVGVIRERSREICKAIIRDLINAGAEGIILGCSEIELLIEPKDVAVATFATTTLHAEAAVAYALDELSLTDGQPHSAGGSRRLSEVTCMAAPSRR